MDAYVDRVPKSSKPKLIYLLTAIILLLFGALGFYVYKDHFAPQNKTDNKEQSVQKEIDFLIEKIGKHIILPVGEEPVLATVSDVEKVRNKAFFQQAKNGDKVLIYTKARKAILYRLSTDRIIEVGPVELDKNKSQPTPTAIPSLSATPSTVIFNKLSPTP